MNSAPPLHEMGVPAARPRPALGFALAWATFCVLLITVGVQDYLRQGGTKLWQPLFWDGSALLVASLIVALQWRRAAALDGNLQRPWRWFLLHLRVLPIIAPVYVAVVFALRHGVYALLGQTYDHEPWSVVFRYEILKFCMFYLLFAAIVFGLRSHAALNQAQLRLARERALTQEAQLLQLTQQIEPHFLFNALNTVAATIATDAELAERLVTQLASLLRAATDLARRPQTTLDEELRLLQAYAAIMCQRFADRVDLRFDIDPRLGECIVPTLCLQPLLENAFRHGVERSSERTTIAVRAERDGERLRLIVQDNAGRLTAAPTDGVGLGNLRQRLATRYGALAHLNLQALAQGGVLAVIELPCVS
ncbi:MAG: histidine kinase [Rhodoferax sp.]|nr:histidine kinase [Rhodoferax sp.]